MPRYTLKQLPGDLSGGFIAALIALPYGLAMASLMGLPPVLGIFTSILTAPITALLGRNPVLIGGTASATVPFIALAARNQGIAGAAKVSIVASMFLLAFGALRLGRYVQKVPVAVVSGFSCGIGAMMVISQLDTIFGVAGPATRNAASTAEQLFATLARLGDAQWAPLVLGVLVVFAATLSSMVSHKLPAPLIGVVAAVCIARLFPLHQAEVGALPFALPPLTGFSWAAGEVFTVLPSAFGLAVVTGVNLLITSRVVEHFRGRHEHSRRQDADIELGAYGLANMVAGAFGAPPSAGIPARSLASVRCGATSRVSNLAHAGFLVAFLWMGAGFVSHIPIPALAGVTAWMGLCLLDWSTWRRLPKMRRADAAAFLVTAMAVLFFNAVAAVASGCCVYGAGLLYRRYTSTTPALGLAEASD
ncbi:MAG: SulP family inorganic anion transporter [Bryobacteraceae bacterium]